MTRVCRSLGPVSAGTASPLAAVSPALAIATMTTLAGILAAVASGQLPAPAARLGSHPPSDRAQLTKRQGG